MHCDATHQLLLGRGVGPDLLHVGGLLDVQLVVQPGEVARVGNVLGRASLCITIRLTMARLASLSFRFRCSEQHGLDVGLQQSPALVRNCGGRPSVRRTFRPSGSMVWNCQPSAARQARRAATSPRLYTSRLSSCARCCRAAARSLWATPSGDRTARPLALQPAGRVAGPAALQPGDPRLELRHGQLEPAHHRVLAAHHRQAQPVPRHPRPEEDVGLAPHVAGARAEQGGQWPQARPEAFLLLPASGR